MRLDRLALVMVVGAAGLAVGGVILAAGAGVVGGGDSAGMIFERRIRPIFDSPNPSSCTQCHLAGVELKNYILPSSEKTFVSFRDQGLIDLDKPEKSRILQLISMGSEKGAAAPPGAARIDPKMRQAEFEAFAAWIAACAKDPALRNAPKLAAADLGKPAAPVEVIRHERIDAVMASFERNVWSQRFRCAGCHTETGSEYARLAKENGDIAWLGKTPTETLGRLVSKELVDVKEPEKSLLLAKPTMAVKHGGGKKMEIGDDGYKAFREFLEDYARIRGEGYKNVAELPKAYEMERFGTDIWLKLEGTPAAWGEKVLEVRVYAWDGQARGFEKMPIAVADRAVAGDAKLWQHSLILVAATGSERAKGFAKSAALPAGRYLVKAYVDGGGKLAKDWRVGLGEEEFVGQVEVQSRWAAGYGSMMVVGAGRVVRP